MKIQIDTKAKTIKIEEEVKISELFEMLEKLLPKGEWKKYKLESTVITNWANPIIIDRTVPYIPPYRSPIWSTGTRPPYHINCGTGGTTTGNQEPLEIDNEAYAPFAGDTKSQVLNFQVN